LSRQFPGRFYFSGFDKQLSDFAFSASTAVISAPSFEPFGYYILQGLVAGSPIVGTQAGGCIDMLTEFEPSKKKGNGFFIEGGESTRQEAFTRTLYRTVDTLTELKKNKTLYNSELKRMMKRVRNDYSVKKMASHYEPIIDRMVSKVADKKSILYSL
ncbi:MAG: hypothetical protein KC535_04715, partial [Nanoarchaeota archaeon]|nr:hypothetical protein [Nanoarchaeota archaeon]